MDKPETVRCRHCHNILTWHPGASSFGRMDRYRFDSNKRDTASRLYCFETNYQTHEPETSLERLMRDEVP